MIGKKGAQMLQTPLCGTLGIALPIWNAGMGGGGAGAELAAAVSNAGGFGVLGMGGMPAAAIRGEIQRTRQLTTRPFGVNLLLPFVDEGQVETCLEEGVAALVLFWGDPTPHIRAARRAHVKVVPQVGSVDEAKAAADAGADAVMVQGVEAGGHVRGTSALSIALPTVVAAVDPLPVVAAGGVANGRGVAAALMLGAQAVSMGTRFLCSHEASVAHAYKERVLRARAEDTVHTGLFDVGWPDAAHRVLRNATTEEWEAAGRPPSGRRPGEGTIVGCYSVGGQVIDIRKYGVDPPMASFEGDIEQTALYCGQSCSLVNDIRPAADIVQDLAREAHALLTSKVS
jgi:NAD(P)H-dependent flavin oxidoreductase YrpB (nitropropane dioxygenase family)